MPLKSLGPEWRCTVLAATPLLSFRKAQKNKQLNQFNFNSNLKIKKKTVL